MWSSARIVIGFATTVAITGAAMAQSAPGSYGQMAGTSYVPSGHDAGCGGVFCNQTPPADPSRPNVPSAAAQQSPQCGGLICEFSNIGTPFPAAEPSASRRARAEAETGQVQALPPAPDAPAHARRKGRSRSARSRSAQVATRTAQRTPALTDAAR